VIYGHADYGTDSAGIYVVGTSPGSTPSYVMALPPPYWSPWGVRFSPDGTRVVFVRGGDLYVVDLESSQELRITFTGGNAGAGDWDPSGRFIVYSRPFLPAGAPDSTAGIHIVDTVTLSDRSLRHDGHQAYGGNPQWSPDSSSIVFWYGTFLKPGESPDMAIHLYTLGVDGSGYRDLTAGSPNDHDYPHWISGGREIIYEKYAEHTHNVHMTAVMDAATAVSKSWPIDLRFPRGVISRDGSHVVFSAADQTGTYGVLYMQEATDATGATRHQITSLSYPATP